MTQRKTRRGAKLMKKQFRKIIAILCTIAMLLSLASAFAEEANVAPETETANAAVELPSGETPSAQEDVPAAGEASDDEGTAPRQETPETDGTASGQDAPKTEEAPAADAVSAGQDLPETQDASEDAAADSNNEEIPQDDGDESDPEEDSEDDGEYEIIDSFGLVDDDVIDEFTPEMTDEFKGFRYAQLSVEKPLEDTIEFDQEMVITLAPAEGDLLLKLYATPGVRFSVKVDSKTASLARGKSDDFSRELYVYELAASASSHEIVLTSDDTLTFRLVAEKKAAEQKADGEAAATGETVAETVAVEPAGEAAADEPAEKAAAVNEPAAEAAADEPAEKAAAVNETAEEAAAAVETAEEAAAAVEPAAEAAVSEPAEEDAAAVESAAEAAVSEPATEAAVSEPAGEIEAPAADSRVEETVQLTDKEYDTLKVGGEISDTLAAGQKAVIQLKCGKNPDVNLTLKAAGDPALRIDGSEIQFTQTGEGTYTALLENVAFRKFTVAVTAAQETAFTISAAAGTENASDMPSDQAMLAKGYIKAFVAIDIGARVYATRDSLSAAGHLKAGTEVWVKLIDGADRAEIYNPDETAFARYINLVDIIATLKPEGMEALPTRELVLTSSLDGQEQVYYGTEVTLNAKLVNFREDDVYTVEWMYTVPGTASDHVVIEGEDQLTFTYTLTEENAKNTWTVLVTLISGQE